MARKVTCVDLVLVLHDRSGVIEDSSFQPYGMFAACHRLRRWQWRLYVKGFVGIG